MILAVDIGNSSVHYGVFEDTGYLLRTFSQPTHGAAGTIADELFELKGISRIAIASVVPTATSELQSHLHRHFPSTKIVVLTNADVPIINRYHHPEQVGIDRLLGSLAAARTYLSPTKEPLVVIDFGTATTFDCLNASGEYLGGIISLGIGSSAKYLSEVAAQLPPIDLTFPEHVLGRSTVESIQSGILFGALESLEGLVRRLSAEVFPNRKPLVVATGGLAMLFKDRTTSIDRFDPFLVLRGILITTLSL